MVIATGPGAWRRPGCSDRQRTLLPPAWRRRTCRSLVDGRPIDLPYRSLFPFVGDLDGDGRDELLLGTPDSGRLKVFPILGNHGRRVLGGPSWFDEKVPDGRIPKG